MVGPKSDAEGEFEIFAEVDFAGQGDVSVVRAMKLPLHIQVAHEVLPSVALPDIADRAPNEVGRATETQVNVLAMGVE